MMFTTSEKIAQEELDVVGYRGKWQAAKELAHDGKPQDSSNIGLPYWERVRNLFLALGGERIDRRRC